MLLVRILVNMLALLFTVAILPSIYFATGEWWMWILLALMLGFLNAFVKPSHRVPDAAVHLCDRRAGVGR